MKKIVFLLMVFTTISIVGRAQEKPSSKEVISSSSDKISHISQNRDTLWLIDDPIGHLIGSSWDKNPTASYKKPVIIYVKELPTTSELTLKK